MKAHQIPIKMLKVVWNSNNKYLRYSKIGTKILSMLNFLSQHIACDFRTSQHKWNAPSQVNDIAACGPGLYQTLCSENRFNLRFFVCPTYCMSQCLHVILGLSFGSCHFSLCCIVCQVFIYYGNKYHKHLFPYVSAVKSLI